MRERHVSQPRLPTFLMRLLAAACVFKGQSGASRASPCVDTGTTAFLECRRVARVANLQWKYGSVSSSAPCSAHVNAIGRSVTFV